MKMVLWTTDKGDVNADLAVTNNYTAVVAPTANDDTSLGYQVGSVWVDTATNTAYTCVDATDGAAIWEVSTSGTAEGVIAAPAASSATGTGGTASLTGGAGGATSGAGGPSSVVGGAGTAGASAGGVGKAEGGVGSPGSGTTAGGVGGIGRVKGGAGGAKSGTGAAAGGAGGDAEVIGGVGGATASSGSNAGGAGGDVVNTAGAGGAASAGTGNGGAGGSVIDTPGAGGTSAGGSAGADGGLFHRGLVVNKQGAPTAKTVSSTLTAAQVLAGIITVNQAGGATSAQQLPTVADLQAALPSDFTDNDSFDFSVINTSTVDAEDASITTNTGWTLVGSMDIPAYSAAGSLNSSGCFRARRTGAGAFTLYRLS